ncbi:MAG: transporter substrate-binding protein [Paenibacillus sp.]|jgi:ABC-type Fe3+-hydroxamate transport system substrate-binding protein|nr:transporter substrate-binding protein [Paenibacillus sp.]
MTSTCTTRPFYRTFAPAALALSLILVSACGNTANPERAESASSGSGPSQAAASPQAASYPLTVSADGKTITIPSKPVRIAALSLDAAEAALELAGAERVSVITKSAADPALAFQSDKAAKVSNQVSSATSLDPERILSYNTDLLLMTKGHDKEKDAEPVLRQAGIPLIALDTWSTFENMWNSYLVLGKAVGEENKAREIVQQMKESLESTGKAIAGVQTKPSALVLSPLGPGTGPYLLGSSNISFEIVEKAGARHAAKDMGVTRSTKASMEQIMKADPDYIILLQWKAGDSSDVEAMTKAAGWSSLKAVQTGNVKTMTVKQMLYPNRYNVDTVRELAEWFHPGPFGK